MKLPFLRPVVPPHVFCLLPEGVTYAHVRRDPTPGFADSRHFPYPSSLAEGTPGAPLVTRESIAECIEAVRKLSGGRFRQASVVLPDSWARILPIDFDSLPEREEAVSEMVLWKLKKLLPGQSSDLSVVFDEMPAVGGEKRLLVAAAPKETLDSIEKSFQSAGVRLGGLHPASLSLFEGFAPVLKAQAGGDYALVHRSAGSFVLLIARDGKPIFFRQRPPEGAEGDHDQEVRLSLSYYAEKLQGPGLAAVFVHDELSALPLADISAFPVPPQPLSARLFSADSDFDRRVAARPELLAAFAAVYGR